MGKRELGTCLSCLVLNGCYQWLAVSGGRASPGVSEAYLGPSRITESAAHNPSPWWSESLVYTMKKRICTPQGSTHSWCMALALFYAVLKPQEQTANSCHQHLLAHLAGHRIRGQGWWLPQDKLGFEATPQGSQGFHIFILLPDYPTCSKLSVYPTKA